jgi:hypothetical protein
MASSLALVSYAVAAAMTVSCVRNIAAGYVKEDFLVFKGIEKKEWARLAITCPLLILALLVALIGLYDHVTGPAAKVLQFSWLSLLASPTDKTAGTNLIVTAGASVPYFGIVFLVLLFLNLPGMARSEEEMFREGTKSWRDGIPRSLAFGLVHCLVGVPVAAGLALVIPGLWFTREYFQGGVDRSTRVHAFYNMMMIPLLAIFVIQATLHK